MREIIEKWIIKKLYQYQLLVFETEKSITHLEQYTRVKFMGKTIKEICWTELELLNRLK